jgi:hypothetical protein
VIVSVVELDVDARARPVGSEPVVIAHVPAVATLKALDV